MDSNTISRLIIGLSLVSIIFLSYFYYLDNFLISVILLLVTYDLYVIKIQKKYLLFISTLFLFFLFIFTPLDLFKYLSFILIVLIFSIIFFDKFKKEQFLISIYLFLIILFYIINIDRNTFYLIIFLSFFNDTVAYIFGRLLGGPLIIPKISPKKTWSGTLISIIVSSFFLIYMDLNIFLSLIISISLFFGDIFFSFIKRYLLLKDFSSLLGSHGGVLDRLDSMFIASIIFQIFIVFGHV